MTLLILNNKIINFDKFICIYIDKDVIIDTDNHYDLFTLKISIEGNKKDIEIFKTKDEEVINKKFKEINSKLKNIQKIYLD